jgi:Tfp pilus assembly protein PilN
VRPVNLIPPEARRGDTAPMRTGALSYVIVAVLAVALLGVTGVVLTNNQVSDRKAEKSSLESQVAEAEAQAQRVSSFASFASLQQAREQTVATLARSRFDWERVLRELAIVIPEDVWLTDLTATVSPDVQLGDTGSSSSSSSGSDVSGMDSVQGPALQIEGCADGHEAVAGFLAALRDIDGVTRVTVLSSDRPDPTSATGGSSAGAAGGASGDCATRDFISKFGIVVAFDAVQIGAGTEATATPPATAQPTASGSTSSAADQSQVSDAQQQLEQQKQSAARQTHKAREDVNTFIPGTVTAP